jgi:predicted metalloprotease with PDZ domain
MRLFLATVVVLVAASVAVPRAGQVPAGVDDLTDPGLPLLKRSFLEGVKEAQGRPDHFESDTLTYFVQQADIHGTLVEVAVHHTASAAGGPPPEAFTAFVLNAFHSAWHVFGGFAYDRYAFKVRPADDLEGFSLSPVGVSITAADYLGPGLHEFAAHEMFHSWNGKLLRYALNGSGTLFQAETWITEGATVYYSFRMLGAVLGEVEYRRGMDYRYEFYRNHVSTPIDLSFAELAARIGPFQNDDPADGELVVMLMNRGAMAAYLLDAEMTQRGSSLDALMRRLYEDSLASGRWAQPELPGLVGELAGDRLEGFFRDYVAGAVRVPVTGRFAFLRPPGLALLGVRP